MSFLLRHWDFASSSEATIPDAGSNCFTDQSLKLVSDALTGFRTSCGFTLRTLIVGHWFQSMCAVILAVSIYDTFLIVKFSETIRHMESNPIGSWLIESALGDVGIFVRVKLAGTLVVMASLYAIHRYSREQISMSITSSVATFQTGLFAYLTFA